MSVAPKPRPSLGQRVGLHCQGQGLDRRGQGHNLQDQYHKLQQKPTPTIETVYCVTLWKYKCYEKREPLYIEGHLKFRFNETSFKSTL